MRRLQRLQRLQRFEYGGLGGRAPPNTNKQIEQHSIKAAKWEVAQLSTPHTPRCPSGVGGFSVLLVRIWNALTATRNEVSRSPRAAGGIPERTWSIFNTARKDLEYFKYCP